MNTSQKRVPTESEVLSIINMYENGYRIEDIAKIMKSRTTMVTKVLKENGIKIKRSVSLNRFVDEHYFDEIDSDEKAYYLGLLFTDGSVTLDPNDLRAPMIRIELVETDVDILKSFRQAIGSGSKITYNKRNSRSNGTYVFGLRSREMSDALRKYGIVNNKTYITDHLPVINERYNIPFVRGLIDGDGSIYYSAGAWHINFCSHSKSICEEFESIVSSIIEKPNHMSVQVSNNVYRVTYNGMWAAKLARACYSDNCISITRKRKLALMAANETLGEDIV